jgi:galactokinase
MIYLTNNHWRKTMNTINNEEKVKLDTGFMTAFGGVPERYFSAPGRTEIGGNHTDHQRGRVLAAAVNLDTQAAVRENGTNTIQVLSQGYPMCCVDLSDPEPKALEVNSTNALIRGVAAVFARQGCPVRGFDAYVTSTVLPGSGLSSSAAFEVLVGTIINSLFFEGKATMPEIAAIGQYAENVYFGKPCGLMDQMASAVGGLVAIDFAERDKPVVQSVDFDFSTCGHALCIIDTHASHADLTEEYAAVPGEMKAVAAYFGKDVLTQVPADEFYAAIPALREQCGDRAVLRSIHFYEENQRVVKQAAALRQGDFPAFLALIKESGRSSWLYLQNVIVCGSVAHQDVALVLALCEKYLQGRGAYRVHGGGFAGTVQAFVPFDLLDDFRSGLEAVLGQDSCHVLTIRPIGGTELKSEELA